MKQNILVILNPAARGERARKLADQIRSLSPRLEVKLTTRIGDARAISSAARDGEYAGIVAAGGDGTVNEVVDGLAGAPVPLGILPVGTMNVFAAELGISGSIQDAWAVIEAGHIRTIDLPLANQSHFVQMAGIGLDAEVVRQTSPDSKRTLGPVSYILTLAQVAARKPPLLSIQPQDGRERIGSFVLVGNGRLYGGPFVLFKNAKLDDGLLDVLVFKNQSHWDIIRYLQAIAFGAHPDLPDVEYFQTPALRIECPQDVPVEVDGELLGKLPYDFGFSQNRLKIFAPAG